MGEEYQHYDYVHCHCHFEDLGDWLGKVMELEEIDNHKLCKIQKIVFSFELLLTQLD